MGPRRMGDNTLSLGEQQYYKTLAKEKLGNKEGNDAVFKNLITSATADLNKPEGTQDNIPSQYSRRQSGRSGAATAHYNAGLGYAGLGNKAKAREEFNAALASTPDYINAKIALDQL
jgi:tetratricopeptide (TPR) repeat protein